MGIKPCTNTDQVIVATPYGRGSVLRRTYNAQAKREMNEIELIDWAQPALTKGRKKPAVLFSPTSFPPVDPEIGDQVQSVFGHGKVMEIREDQILVVRISSWRLARRSMVTCYLSKDSVRVIPPISVSRMNIWEKIEYAQDLKASGQENFSAKRYREAFVLFSKAVDTVRYVQHNTTSSNENR